MSLSPLLALRGVIMVPMSPSLSQIQATPTLSTSPICVLARVSPGILLVILGHLLVILGHVLVTLGHLLVILGTSWSSWDMSWAPGHLLVTLGHMLVTLSHTGPHSLPCPMANQWPL
ncbi:hypothetical protein TURU_000993 [Turdus rufiventris]|nr:hypothetical protein TURU_000993 [Turdus rufiventris]